MSDLIERLESATEGSRELSDEVLEASGWRRDDLHVWQRPDGSLSHYKDRPNPTCNLHDAASLVPGELLVKLDFSKYGARAGLFGSRVEDMGHHGSAATPALALCIASLKAREME